MGGHVDPVSVLANVATGGLYGTAQGLVNATQTGKLSDVYGAANNLGPYGSVVNPISPQAAQAGNLAGAGAGIGGALTGGNALGASLGASTAQQGGQLAGQYAAMQQPGPPGPDTALLAQQAQQAQQAAAQQAVSGQIGKTSADLASRGVTGASPQFLAQLSSQQAGQPGFDAFPLVQQYLAGRG